MTDEEVKALLDADGLLERVLGIFCEAVKNVREKINEMIEELKKAVDEGDSECWPFCEIIREKQKEKTKEGFPRLLVTPDP